MICIIQVVENYFLILETPTSTQITNHKSQIKTTTQKTFTHNIDKILYLSLDKSWTKYLNL